MSYYDLRMRDTHDASEAARELARARWGTQVLDKAVGVVVTRSAELDQAQRDQLAAAISSEGDAGA